MLERGVPSLRAAITEYSDPVLLELIDVAKLRIREGFDTPIEYARVVTVFRCLREEAAERGLSAPIAD